MKNKLLLGIISLSLVSTGLIGCSSNGGKSNNDEGRKECNHVDANSDHLCDLCSTTLSEHTNFNNDHNCDYCGAKLTEHIDSDTNYKCDICDANMDVKSLAVTKVTTDHFVKGTDFTSSGIEVTYTFNGSASVIDESQYEVDSSAFKRGSVGEYNIKVSLKDDANVSTTYEVKVVDIVAISTNEDYRKTLILNENTTFETFNLKFYFVYSDGTKKEFEDFNYDSLSGDLETDEVGKQSITFSYAFNSCKIEYEVIKPTDATVKSITLHYKFPEYAAVDELANFKTEINGTYSFADIEFEESGGKTIYLKTEYDTSELDNIDKTIGGSADVSFTYNGFTIKKTVNLVALSSLTFDKVEVDYDKDFDIYYTESLSSFESTFEINRVYSGTFGGQKIEVRIPTNLNRYSRVSGDTNTIADDVVFSYSDEYYGSFSVVADVVALPTIPSGIYCDKEVFSGMTILDPAFYVNEDGTVQRLDSDELRPLTYFDCTLYSVSRREYEDQEDKYYLHIGYLYYYNAVASTWESFDVDLETGKIINYDYFDAEPEDMIYIYLEALDDTIYTFPTNGKLDETSKNTISRFGDLYHCTVTFNPDDEEEDPTIVKGEKADINGAFAPGYYEAIIEQQDGTGQPFLGKYVSNSIDEALGMNEIVINADNITFVADGDDIISKYRFTKTDEGYEIVTSLYGIICYVEGNELSFTFFDAPFKFTKEEAKQSQ